MKCSNCGGSDFLDSWCIKCTYEANGIYDIREQVEFAKKVQLVLDDPRFHGTLEEAEYIVQEIAG